MISGDAQVPRALPSLEHLHGDGLRQESCKIARETLLTMSRGELKRYLTIGPDEDSSYVPSVQALWRSLLATMRETSVVDAHLTAACNAICVFLGSASSSPVLSVQTFAMSAETWMAIFDALLHRFDVGKIKPLRQVLTALIKILANHPDSSRARSIEDDVLSRIGAIILLGKPAIYLKASMVIFEAFIRSNIPVSRILSAIGRCHAANREQWNHRLRRERIDPIDLCLATSRHDVDESIGCFSLSVILTAAHSDIQATAGTFFIRMVSMLLDSNVSLEVFWIEQVATTLERYPESIEAFKNYLLPSLLKLLPDQCYSLLHKTSGKDGDSDMLQTALSIAIVGRDGGFLTEQEIVKSLRIVLERGPEQGQFQPNNDSDGAALFTALLTHSSAGVRIRVYELLATCQEKTKPIRSSILSLLSKHLTYLHGDPDPAHRGEISTVTVTMINRLRQGSSFHSKALSKPGQTNCQYDEHKYELQQHEEFIDRFIDFIEDELGPNCSFPRHISALKALQSLVESRLDPSIPSKASRKSGKDLMSWPFQKSLTYRNLRLVLWCLILDPFEEIRATVTPILESILQSGRCTTDLSQGEASDGQETISSNLNLPLVDGEPSRCHALEEVAWALEDANYMAALTNRADHADGVGRLIRLQHIFSPRPSLISAIVLEQVRKVLSVSNVDKSLLEKPTSLHGSLMGLKYIVEDCSLHETSDQTMLLNETSVTVDQLLRLCNDIWHTVREDLCVDSPEMSHEADEMGPLEGPKDFLSYSWRALRDSSLLIQALLVHLGSGSEGASQKSGRVQHLRTIYALCFEQLTALRHRGAFSTVAQTFALCCEQAAGVPSLRDDFATWYQDAFRILEDQSSKLTRRSAGLPAIMAALLIPSTSEEFNGVLKTLSTLAISEPILSTDMTNEEEIRLPQVHALNCLREILTDSRFKSRSIAWLTEVLSLAASSLSSTIWAIRNCGLMLFRACASRIGTTADKSEFDIYAIDPPGQRAAILDIAFQLLGLGKMIPTDSSELVFAGLDLLSRISIPANDRVSTRERILAHLGNSTWLIREHAARVFASQISEPEALEAVIGLIASMDLTEQNRCHGILLCSRKLVKKYFHASLPFPDAGSLNVEHVLQLHAPSILKLASPAVQSAFLDIVNDYIAFRRRLTPSYKIWVLKGVEEIRRVHFLDERNGQVNSPIPFVPQLYASMALNASLIALTGAGETAQTLHQTFVDVAARDNDAAAALLLAITSLMSSDQLAVGLLVDFYIRIIQDDHEEDIIAMAMFELSSSLLSLLDSEQSLFPKQDLRYLANCLVSLRHNERRELFNARISALGSVLALRSREGQSVWSDTSSDILSVWIKMLSSAARDSTEAPTRLVAAKSLHGFRSCFPEKCDRAATQKKFKVYLILYDLLNDDDEEIRDLAASTTSFILTAATSGRTVQLCPLAACRRFADYLAESFTSNDGFHFEALSRLMFSASTEVGGMQSFAAPASQHSVKKQLDFARQMSYDLFEEERQNLYWDEVREINIWRSALGRISRSCMEDDVLLLAGKWALEGLHELTAALSSLNDGPFGVWSKLEMVSLSLRVIGTADLCLKWDSSSDFELGPPKKSPYLDGMERLLSLSQVHRIHPQARKALEASVKREQLGLEELEVQWKSLRLHE